MSVVAITGIELDRVEQYRPPIDQDDVAEMGVAMAAAYEAFRRARLHQ